MFVFLLEKNKIKFSMHFGLEYDMQDNYQGIMDAW